MAQTSVAQTELSSGFCRDTMDSVTRVRAGLLAALRPSTGVVHKSRDLQKALGVDVKLSWQAYRVCNSDSYVDMALHMPTGAQVRKLLRAASKRGASADVVDEVESAYAEFERVIDRHAGDRASFDAMLRRMAGGEADESLELMHREAGFEAQRYLWGVELDVSLSAEIVHPSAGGGEGVTDELHVRMRHGLKRFAADGVIPVDRRFVAPSAGLPPPGAPEPLDTEAYGRFGVPLLPGFCSTEDLRFARRTREDGATVTDWVTEELGRTSAVTLAFGERINAVPLLTRGDGRRGITRGMTFLTPTRLLVSDLLVHRPTFGRWEHEATRWGHAVMFPRTVEPLEAMGLPRLACRESVGYMGSGAAAAEVPEVPRYAAMLRDSCDRAGWDLDEMDVYRIRIQYPVMHTLLLLRHTMVG